ADEELHRSRRNLGPSICCHRSHVIGTGSERHAAGRDLSVGARVRGRRLGGTTRAGVELRGCRESFYRGRETRTGTTCNREEGGGAALVDAELAEVDGSLHELVRRDAGGRGGRAAEPTTAGNGRRIAGDGDGAGLVTTNYLPSRALIDLHPSSVRVCRWGVGTSADGPRRRHSGWR